jgi:hypothetical protein
MKAVHFFEMSWRNYPTTKHNNPEDMLLHFGDRFATSLSAICCFKWVKQYLCHYSRQIFHYIIHYLSLACYTSKKKVVMFFLLDDSLATEFLYQSRGITQ